MAKISVYVKRGVGSKEDPYSLVEANIYADNKYIGFAGAGGCNNRSGLVGIELSEEEHIIRIASGGDEMEKEVLIDKFQKVLIFNLTTQEVEKY